MKLFLRIALPVMALVIVCTAVNAGGDLFGFEPPEITSIMADDFLPDANNTYDLGSYDFSWKDIYASGTAYIGGVNIPDVYTAKEEPTGFVNKDNVITWDDATRTISIAGDHDILFTQDSDRLFYFFRRNPIRREMFADLLVSHITFFLAEI